MTPSHDFLDHPAFSDLDRHFARFIGRLDGRDELLVPFAAACVSQALSRGHVCLNLGEPPDRSEEDSPIVEKWPSWTKWKETLSRSPAVGTEGDFAPLILDETAKTLYLERYWAYEKSVADWIVGRCAKEAPMAAATKIETMVDRYFPSKTAGGKRREDHQRLAAIRALTHSLCIISGGPGTGKTTTVLKILALLLECAGDQPLRMALAAPTGKAAMRLRDTVERGLAELPLDVHLKDRLPREAVTIHRLLGGIPDTVRFRHHADAPLPLDVLVVDEASMIDLPLMAKLFDALPDKARLILLGDHDQLASVEVGSVFGDITLAGTGKSPLKDRVAILDRNYRFGEDTGIFRLTQAVRREDGDEAWSLLKNASFPDLCGRELAAPSQLAAGIRDAIVEGFRGYLQSKTPEEALQRFNHFRVLAPVRSGPYGITALNALIEQILRTEKLISASADLYPLLPVLITQNDYALRLFNGDIGILFEDPEQGGKLSAFFPGEDRELRRLSPLRLPAHEKAFAMTVHKSQGSEFERVLVIFPDRDRPVLTRELVYTAVSRAQAHVEIRASRPVFQAALKRTIDRNSGLIRKIAG
jgi:exodeoxyribonuclease V alpha subunit